MLIRKIVGIFDTKHQPATKSVCTSSDNKGVYLFRLVRSTVLGSIGHTVITIFHFTKPFPFLPRICA